MKNRLDNLYDIIFEIEDALAGVDEMITGAYEIKLLQERAFTLIYLCDNVKS